MANFEANFPQFELKFINQVIGMMPRIISNADTVIFCPKSGKSNRGRCQRHLCSNVELQQNVADSSQIKVKHINRENTAHVSM